MADVDDEPPEDADRRGVPEPRSLEEDRGPAFRAKPRPVQRAAIEAHLVRLEAERQQVAGLLESRRLTEDQRRTIELLLEGIDRVIAAERERLAGLAG